AIRRRGALADGWREKGPRGRSDWVGLDLRFPPEAVVERPLGARLPGVLDIRGVFGLRDVLRPRRTHGAAHARLLEEQQQPPGVARVLDGQEGRHGREDVAGV